MACGGSSSASWRRSGLDPRYATHSCRHSYATHLYRASGGDLEVVQEQLGHANIKTTTVYAKITKEDKLKAANALAKTYQEFQRKQVGLPTWPKRIPEHRPDAMSFMAPA